MSDVYAPLRADLRGILLAVPQLPPVAWEGRKFVPDPTVAYIEEELVPVASTVATLGSSGNTRDDVVYNLKIHYPEATASVSDIETFADSIIAAFWSGRRVGSPTVYGNVTGTLRSKLMPTPGRISIAVRVRFFVYRNTAPA